MVEATLAVVGFEVGTVGLGLVALTSEQESVSNKVWVKYVSSSHKMPL